MATTSTLLESHSTVTTPDKMRSVLERQRAAFAAEVPTYEVRIDRTNRLIALMVENKDEIVGALNEDFGHRSVEGSLLTDVWFVIDSYKYNKIHLHEWMLPETHEALFPDAEARVECQAKGVVGVVSPWNFPWNLSFDPIGSAIAAGNRVMLKPSELTPAVRPLDTYWQHKSGLSDHARRFSFPHTRNSRTRGEVTCPYRKVCRPRRCCSQNSNGEDFQCRAGLPCTRLRAFAQRA